MRALRTYLCAHDYLRRFEPHRVYLRCDKCGHETPGLRDDYTDLAKPRVVYPPPAALRVVPTKKRRSA